MNLSLLLRHLSFTLGDIGTFFTNLRGDVTNFALAASGFFFVWAAFLYMTAGHNERRIEQSRLSLYAALGGLALILLASTITTLINGAATGQ